MEIDLFEIFKAFPVCVTVLVVIPVAFLTSPACGAHEFKAFRMQHYDLHGVPYGRYILLCLIRWAIQGICLTSCALIKGKISQFDREIQLENEVKYLSL